MFQNHLVQDLIPFWNKLRDDTFGGFYGYVDGNGKPDPKREKGVILNSRILWFYSSAYLLLRDPQLLGMAEHAYRFMVEHCVDGRYGGVFWSVHYDGSVCDDTKHCYNQAFAIYALSAYYRASGDKAALNQAYELYRIIESKCKDAGGYLEAFHRDFTPAGNDKLSENGVLASRTMNTLLHVLEAYTELYRADSFDRIGDSIREILHCFKNKIYDSDKKMCQVFFDEVYHSLIDLDSYGHDIEASWLLDRACEVLADDVCSREMQPVIDGLAEGALEHAIDTGLIAMNNECENGIVSTRKIWWVQAEAVIGFYNAYEHHREQPEYRALSEHIWEFIQKYVIDGSTREWIEEIEDVSSIDRSQALVHPWKCPYHNGRMCMEMFTRLENNNPGVTRDSAPVK